MKFLLDENFPRSAVEVIAECGHLAIPFEEVCTHYTLGLWLLHFVSRIVPQFIRVSGGSWRMSKSH